MGKNMSILVIADVENIKEQMQSIIEDYKNVHFIYPTEVKKEIDRISPRVVIIYRFQDESSNIDHIQYIQSEMPSINILFATDTEDFELLRNVTRAGALDFFVLPNELVLLAERLDKIDRLSKQDEALPINQNFKRGRGQVISFYSGKGGEGCSFLASSFAQTLKLESTAKVVLLDLNLQFGGIESFLGVESNRSFVDLIPVANELNENHIRNVVEKEKCSGLELLLSPKDAETAESISDDFISKLIRACRRSYDFVIIDLPSEITENPYTALEESDLIYYVMNLNSLSLNIYKQVEILFKRLNIDTSERLEFVINKTSKDNELKTSDLKKFVSEPISTEIRLDFKGIQLLINQGIPLRKEQNERKLSPLAKDIRKWVLGKI